MLTETVVSAFLTASITGAGLVLAVYALIIPLSRRFFSYRAEEFHKEIQEFKEEISKLDTTSASANVLGELKTMLEGIEEQQGFPTYLSWGAGLTFFGYIVSTFLSFFWLIDFNKPTMDSWLPLTFFVSTIFFLLLGLFSIKDIGHTMKREFEDLKKELKSKIANKV